MNGRRYVPHREENTPPNAGCGPALFTIVAALVIFFGFGFFYPSIAVLMHYMHEKGELFKDWLLSL